MIYNYNQTFQPFVNLNLQILGKNNSDNNKNTNSSCFA